MTCLRLLSVGLSVLLLASVGHGGGKKKKGGRNGGNTRAAVAHTKEAEDALLDAMKKEDDTGPEMEKPEPITDKEAVDDRLQLLEQTVSDFKEQFLPFFEWRRDETLPEDIVKASSEQLSDIAQREALRLLRDPSTQRLIKDTVDKALKIELQSIAEDFEVANNRLDKLQTATEGLDEAQSVATREQIAELQLRFSELQQSLGSSSLQVDLQSRLSEASAKWEEHADATHTKLDVVRQLGADSKKSVTAMKKKLADVCSAQKCFDERCEMQRKECEANTAKVAQDLDARFSEMQTQLSALDVTGRELLPRADLTDAALLKVFKRQLADKIERYAFFVFKPVLADSSYERQTITLKHFVGALRDNGVQLRLKGGLIRDLALNIVPSDVDFDYALDRGIHGEKAKANDVILGAFRDYFENSVNLGPECVALKDVNERAYGFTSVRFKCSTSPVTHLDFTDSQLADGCGDDVNEVFTVDGVKYDLLTGQWHGRRVDDALRDLLRRTLRIGVSVDAWMGRGLAEDKMQGVYSRVARRWKYALTPELAMGRALDADIQQRAEELYKALPSGRLLMKNAVCNVMCLIADAAPKYDATGALFCVKPTGGFLFDTQQKLHSYAQIVKDAGFFTDVNLVADCLPTLE